jgi:hypothetical protein
MTVKISHRLAVLAFAMSIVSARHASAEDWFDIGTQSNGEPVLVRTDSIVWAPPIVRFWMRLRTETPNPKYLLSRYEVDCSLYRFRMIAGFTLDPDSQVSQDFGLMPDEPFREIRPDSIMDEVSDVFCLAITRR